MTPFRDRPIRSKLNLLLASAAGLALLLACAAFVTNDVALIRASTLQNLSAIADVVGANTVPALTFNDRDTATEVLSSFRFEPIVRFACVYTNDRQVFASYQRDTSVPFTPPPSRGDSKRFTSDGHLELFTTLSDSQDHVGHLYVQAGMDHLQTQLRRYAGMAFLVALLSLGAAMLFSSKLQQAVSVPILRLAKTADEISREGNYGVRIEKTANDEIGSLFDAFNRMLAQIQTGEIALRKAHEGLEDRVQERTQQLAQANEELSREIVEREHAEEELKVLQRQHIETARRVGQSEIASSVLHNVGNVLNSVNVSAGLISERLRDFGISDLSKATDIMEQHLDNLGNFVTQDERGKHLAPFLIDLSHQMTTDEEDLLQEVESLTKNVEHIRDIITLQQSHTGVSGLVQEASLADLIEDAIRINSSSAERHGIEIACDFEDVPIVAIDRQKLVQVLVNLVSNAKYALIHSDLPKKQMSVRMCHVAEDRVRIDVQDNGIGIAEENLTRIFSHGFTTRKEGHGFGLHSASLAVKELDGELTVCSEGPGKGAIFSIVIPVQILKPVHG